MLKWTVQSQAVCLVGWGGRSHGKDACETRADEIAEKQGRGAGGRSGFREFRPNSAYKRLPPGARDASNISRLGVAQG